MCNLQNKSDWAECPFVQCSRGVLQPAGIRRFGIGVSQLPPLRPAVLGNGDPLIGILRNALTFERILQRPAPSHLWTTNRSKMRYSTSQ